MHFFQFMQFIQLNVETWFHSLLRVNAKTLISQLNNRYDKIFLLQMVGFQFKTDRGGHQKYIYLTLNQRNTATPGFLYSFSGVDNYSLSAVNLWVCNNRRLISIIPGSLKTLIFYKPKVIKV